MPPGHPALRIDLASHLAHLRDVQQMEDDTFGAAAVPWEVLLAWRTAYRDAVFTLRADDALVGYTSLWPVTRPAYEALLSGQRPAIDLEATDIGGSGHDLPETWWHWSRLALRPAWRGTGLGRRLADIAMQRWLQGVDDAHVIHVAAMAGSPEGAQVLLQRGFHGRVSARESVAGMATYHRTASAGTWRAMVAAPDR